ncbi:transglutaminase family protein [Mesorhizobium sp. CAU 1741]|uniref:transglutaminase-like domain-containing protein n=1 Tax=Mesorhizobium sp. CAU 1741 TaxID=3140366 RepID=UPI00325B68C6
MLIRVGYKIAIEVEQPTPLYTLMEVHPDRRDDVLWSRPALGKTQKDARPFTDVFGNSCQRLVAKPGVTFLGYDAVVEDSGLPDPTYRDAEQISPDQLPDECLTYLLGSRYCETDKLMSRAWQLFGDTEPGWARVQAICDFVNSRLNFSYGFARSTRTALEAYDERVGVCRDFAHLAIAFCRAMNIPARYVNGYMGDIGIEPDPAPMDFNAWFEVYLGDRWHTFDARHNERRIGRIVVARGRDAADVPLLHTFGPHRLQRFEVWTEEHQGALPIEVPHFRRREGSSRYGPPGRSPRDLGQGDNVTYLL